MTIIFTCGDPYSINIEATRRVLVPTQNPIIGIGSLWHWQDQCQKLQLSDLAPKVISSWDQVQRPGFYWMDLSVKVPKLDARELSERVRGEMVVATLASIPKNFKCPTAVVTGPINKKVASMGGYTWPGQTEFFEDLWAQKAVMMLAGAKLRVALATNHLPLSHVAPAITQERIVEKLRLLQLTAKDIFDLEHPRIAVCGLNPHGGDGGLFGMEDELIIKPAVVAARARGIDAVGPLPADTVFYQAYTGQYDMVLAMYHDQGLGPLKLVHFDDAVNISMGLPYLRISPDHGPASDRYLQGTASVKSYGMAFELAERWLASQAKVISKGDI